MAKIRWKGEGERRRVMMGKGERGEKMRTSQ